MYSDGSTTPKLTVYEFLTKSWFTVHLASPLISRGRSSSFRFGKTAISSSAGILTLKALPALPNSSFFFPLSLSVKAFVLAFLQGKKLDLCQESRT